MFRFSPRRLVHSMSRSGHRVRSDGLVRPLGAQEGRRLGGLCDARIDLGRGRGGAPDYSLGR